jgi:hypothetical protein
MFPPSNVTLLAEMLRGGGAHKHVQRTWGEVEDAPPRGGLPKALVHSQAQQAAREAEALRLATTPRAWVDGDESTPNCPSAEGDTPEADPAAETPPQGE